MAEVKVITVSKDELETLIIDSVAAALKFHLPVRNEPKPEPAPAGEGLLTKRQAAGLLSCSPSTIDNMARAGRLTRRYIGKTVRFERREVLGLARAKRQAQPEPA